MVKIKIAHEAPKSIFEDVQKLTDYDYFLANVLEEDKEYLDLALSSVKAGRETILDNGVFETGEALNLKRFAEWVNIIKPTYYIVPDKLDDTKGTIENMKEWCSVYKSTIDSRCKMIGVVQGTTMEEIEECYRFMNEEANADKIAFSFDSKLYDNTVKHPNKLISWTLGRVQMLSNLKAKGIINENKPHHLLGCSYPLEFQFYSAEDFPWIDSVDTSNPVIAGIKETLYDQSMGMRHKDSVKLYTLLNLNLSDRQKEYIRYNIEIFKKCCDSLKFN